MHLDQAPRVGPLVQIVDVLGHQQDIAPVIPLQPGKRRMCCVGVDTGHSAAAPIVELVHLGRITPEPLRRRDLAKIHLRPDAVFVAECIDAGFG